MSATTSDLIFAGELIRDMFEHAGANECEPSLDAQASANEIADRIKALALEMWDGPTDSDGEPCVFVNHYEHCGEAWADQWSSACNDPCPVCGAEIEPHRTEDAPQ